MLENKNVLITGGASGIGKECALLFASHGAVVAISDIDGEKGAALLEQLKEYNQECGFFPADLSRDAAKACDWYLDKYKAPDIWLNTAGAYRPAFIDEMPEADLDYMLSLNLVMPFLVMQRLAPSMKEKGGSVIQFSSEFGAIKGHLGVSGYAATKGGLYAMTNAFAMEYAPYGIRANSINPGVGVGFMGDLADEEMVKRNGAACWERVTPFPRRAENIEAANLALFLASDMSKHITGEGIYLDGGQHVISHNNGHNIRRDWR